MQQSDRQGLTIHDDWQHAAIDNESNAWQCNNQAMQWQTYNAMNGQEPVQ